jgi:hypothetical protein
MSKRCLVEKFSSENEPTHIRFGLPAEVQCLNVAAFFIATLRHIPSFHVLHSATALLCHR